MIRFLFLLCFSACLLVASARSASAQPQKNDTAEARERARELLRQALQSYDAGDKSKAFELLKSAWVISQSFDIACNLGNIALALNQYRDAAEYLDYCVRFHQLSTSDEIIARERKARASLDKARQLVGSITLSVEPPGAEVFVDGVRTGQAPLAAPVFVTPGAHVISARFPGYADEQQNMEAAPGTEQSIALRLKRSESASPKAARPSEQQSFTQVSKSQTVTQHERDSGIQPRTVAIIVGASATGVAVVLGGVFAALASSAENDANSKQDRVREQWGESGCSTAQGAGSQTCQDMRDAFDKRDTHAALSTVSFIAAGTFALATSAVFVFWENKQESPRGARVAPFAGRGVAGLVVCGGF